MKTKRTSKPQPPPLWGRDKDGLNIYPTAEQIVEGIRVRRGRLWLDADYQLHYRLPKKNFKRLKALIKEHKSCVFQYLLERQPKVEIPVVCRCSAKPYPHLDHDSEDEPGVRIKGTLPQLREALIQCKSQPEGWDMNDLIDYMKEAGAEEGEL